MLSGFVGDEGLFPSGGGFPSQVAPVEFVDPRKTFPFPDTCNGNDRHALHKMFAHAIQQPPVLLIVLGGDDKAHSLLQLLRDLARTPGVAGHPGLLRPPSRADGVDGR